MSSDIPRNPGFEQVHELLIEVVLSKARSSLPAKLLDFDEDKQRGSVQIMIPDVHLDEDLERVVESIAPIHHVPVKFFGSPRGRITAPMATGDLGLLFFQHASIAKLLLSGKIVDPKDDRRHDINDCVFVPGFHTFADVPTSAPTDALVLHCGDGIKAKLGGPDGTQPFPLKLVIDQLNAAVQAAIVALTDGGPSVAQGLAAMQALRTALTALNWPVPPSVDWTLDPGAFTEKAEAK